MDAAFRHAVAQARRQGQLYFASLLPEEHIHRAFGQARWLWQGWIYTPAVTVWVFLAQCLSPDHSCCDAVAQLIAWLLACGRPACSAETGAYCSARDRLPEETCRRLARDSGRQVEEDAPASWRWLGHRVVDVDGSTLTMADTPANQADYPQLASQKPGCGFPIARLVVVFSLAVGTVLDAVLARYEGKQTGENSLFRTLHELLCADDVVLADRYFGGWFDLALLRQRGVHNVVRKHQLRATDFRTGVRLGRNDHLVYWSKPQRPAWMSHDQYRSLPAVLVLREVRVRVEQPGFRTKEVIVVTTLLEAERYAAAALAKLYRRRWQAELNLRSLKVALQMEHLRCKTPQVSVRRTTGRGGGTELVRGSGTRAARGHGIASGRRQRGVPAVRQELAQLGLRHGAGAEAHDQRAQPGEGVHAGLVAARRQAEQHCRRAAAGVAAGK